MRFLLATFLFIVTTATYAAEATCVLGENYYYTYQGSLITVNQGSYYFQTKDGYYYLPAAHCIIKS